MGKFKVLHVSSALSWRGGEQQLVNLIEGLELLYPDLTQHLFCAKNSEIELYCNENKIAYCSCLKKSGISKTYISGLRKYIKEFNPAIIHIHDSHAHTAVVIAHKRLRSSIPIVLHRRVDFPVSKSILSNFKYKYKHIKKIIAVSSVIKKIVDEKLGLKAEVIHSSVRSQPILSAKGQGSLRSELTLNKDKILIGNISALADHKDYPTFLECASILCGKSDNIHFVIIGDGEQRDLIEKLILEKKLENKVSLLGHRKDVNALIHELDVFLMTSHMEGLGSVILYPFTAKVPVVATNAGGITDFVKHNITGLSSAPGDANHLSIHVEKVLKDKELRDKLISNARQLAIKNEFTQMASKTYELYTEMI